MGQRKFRTWYLTNILPCIRNGSSSIVIGTVVYTATGGVDIQDGTGTVVETYPSCSEAQACQ
jgi:hypothetical protein